MERFRFSRRKNDDLNADRWDLSGKRLVKVVDFVLKCLEFVITMFEVVLNMLDFAGRDT